jgi:hypothetical protein
VREIVTAQVNGPTGPVSSGMVTFNVAGNMVQAVVVNGVATATVILPASVATANESVSASFSGTNFATSTQAKTAYLNLFSAFFPTVATFNSDGTETVTVQLGFMPLIYTYDASGNLTGVFLGFLPL